MISQDDKGITLADTMIVVAIISVFAVIAFPLYSSSSKYEVDMAAQEVSAAIQFTRSEALRTGDVYGIDINRATNQLTIYKADLSANPVAQEFIVYHPINKNLYNYKLSDDFKFSNIEISNTNDPFLFSDSIRRSTLLFTAQGVPVWIDTNSGAIHQLQSGIVSINSKSHSINVNVTPYSGRVTTS